MFEVEVTYIAFETTPPSEDEITSQIWDTLERFPQMICEYDGQS